MGNKKEFKNINEIRKEFNLNESSPKELRKELRRKLANLHPDKNKGDSSTDRFKQVNHAMEYLDEFLRKETDLIINEEDNEIEEVLNQLISVKQKTNLNDGLKEKIETAKKEFDSKFKIPRITLTSVTSILTFLWVLPNNMKENIIFNSLINVNNLYIKVLWVIMILITVSFWLYSAYEKYKQGILKTNLQTETFQNKLLEEFFDDLYSKDTFTKDEFVYFLTSKKYKPRLSNIIMHLKSNKREFGIPFNPRGNINIELAQELANTVFLRAENNNVIKKIDKKTLSKTYILDNDYEKINKWY